MEMNASKLGSEPVAGEMLSSDSDGGQDSGKGGDGPSRGVGPSREQVWGARCALAVEIGVPLAALQVPTSRKQGAGR